MPPRSDAPSELRRRADRIAAKLSRDPGIEAVMLYGSVARGDATAHSDIDFLVVGAHGDQTIGDLRRRTASVDPQRRASFVFHTGESLDNMIDEGSRFLVHLRLEGEILLDREGRLSRIFAAAWNPVSVEQEIAVELSRLENYDRPEIFGGQFLFPLAHVYTIGKAIVMAKLADEGRFEFNRRRAFAKFAREHPKKAADVAEISSLEAFRARTARHELPLPFSPVGDNAGDRLLGAVAAIRRIAEDA